MKKFLFIVMASLLTLAASSQTRFARNTAGAIVRKVKTTDATATTVDNVTVAANEVGIITVTAIGVDTSTMAAITGTKSYRYSKVAGTLTLGTAVIDPTDSVVVDSGVSTSTFAASASSNNILIRVTGKASTTIYWKVITKQVAILKE